MVRFPLVSCQFYLCGVLQCPIQDWLIKNTEVPPRGDFSWKFGIVSWLDIIILRFFLISVPNCENEGRKLICRRYKLQYQLNLCTVRFTNSVDWFLFCLGPIGSWKDYVLPTWICKSCTVCSYLISCTYLATYHI